MTPPDNGGAAFPRQLPTGEYPLEDVLRIIHEHAGMSLRDYFAVHSTQPGISEIVSMAGKVWRMNRVWPTEESVNPVWDTENAAMPFEQWWESIPLAERLDLAARVRYAQADAMLRARAAAGPPPP